MNSKKPREAPGEEFRTLAHPAESSSNYAAAADSCSHQRFACRREIVYMRPIWRSRKRN